MRYNEKELYSELSSFREKLYQANYLEQAQTDFLEEVLGRIEDEGPISDRIIDEWIAIGGELLLRKRDALAGRIITLLREQPCREEKHPSYPSFKVLDLKWQVGTQPIGVIAAEVERLEKALEKEEDLYFKGQLNSLKGLVNAKQERIMEATFHYLEAAHFFEEGGYLDQAALSTSNAGLLYAEIKLHEKSIANFKKALEWFEELGLVHRIVDQKYDIALSYKNIEAYDTAMMYNLEVLDFYKKDNNRFKMAMVYSALGNLSLDLKKYDQSLLYIDSSLAICEEMGIGYGLMLNYINQANTYYNKGEYQAALQSLKRSETYIKGPLPVDGEQLLNRLYADTYTALGQHSTATFYYKKIMEMVDTIYESELHSLVLSMDNSYVELQAEKQVEQMDQMVRSARLQRSVALLGILLSVFAVLGVYLWARNRRKQHLLEVDLARRKLHELEMEMELQEKDRLYDDMREQFIQKISGEMVDHLKRLKFSLPVSYREQVDIMMRELSSDSIPQQISEIDQKLSNVNEAYEQRLLELYPDLSPTELKLCNLIKLNLTTREISKILNRSEKTVSNYRSVIRRKMEIDTNTNLVAHLMNI